MTTEPLTTAELETERQSYGYRNNTILVGDRGKFRRWDDQEYVTGYVQDIVISLGSRTLGPSVHVMFKRDGYREIHNVDYAKFARNFVPE